MSVFDRPFIEIASTSGDTSNNHVTVINIIGAEKLDVNELLELVEKLAQSGHIYFHGLSERTKN